MVVPSEERVFVRVGYGVGTPALHLSLVNTENR